MKMKILVAGPKGSGKSMITNYLASHNFADKNPSLTSENFPYYPTAGVRIVEHEIKVNGINEDLTLELWDTSGDHK
jgi:GTPase SAR1 family protein